MVPMNLFTKRKQSSHRLQKQIWLPKRGCELRIWDENKHTNKHKIDNQQGSTWNYIQCLIITYNGKNPEKNRFMYNWINLLYTWS